MPRFLFHTNHPDSGTHTPLEYSTVQAAKCEAVRYAGQLLCDVAENFWDRADFELTVTDEKGLILFSMRLVGIEAPAIRSPVRSH